MQDCVHAFSFQTLHPLYRVHLYVILSCDDTRLNTEFYLIFAIVRVTFFEIFGQLFSVVPAAVFNCFIVTITVG